MQKEEAPFYAKGLRFQCTNCSNCCRHDPGYVFLNEEDRQALMSITKLSRRDFISTYCRIVDIHGFKRVSLIEKPNYDCIFWADGGCTVYQARPVQCRSYPFWSPFLESREDWDQLEASCPGVNQGRLHSRKKIEQWLDMRGKFLTDRDVLE